MKIEFEYLNNDNECNFKNKDKAMRKFGCCCKCQHRLELHKQCCHSPIETGKCVCVESLNIYACSYSHDIEKPYRNIHLCGKHGCCEAFAKISK